MKRRKLLGLLPFLAAPAVLRAETVDLELVELIKNSDYLSCGYKEEWNYSHVYFGKVNGLCKALNHECLNRGLKIYFSKMNRVGESIFDAHKISEKRKEYFLPEVKKAVNYILSI